MSDKDEALRLADALQRSDLIDFDGDFTAAAACLRRQHEEIEALNAECDALLSDWNALVKASGSRTNGGAVGHVAAMRAERDALRAALELYRGQVDQTGRHSAAEAIERAMAGQLGLGVGRLEPERGNL